MSNNIVSGLKNFFASNSDKSEELAQYTAVCVCNKGKVRSVNQDNFYFGGAILPSENDALEKNLRAIFDENASFAVGVFDGMGGEKHGEQAAFIAAEHVKKASTSRWQDPKKAMLDICLKANDAICNLAEELGGRRMGCTVAMLYFTQNTAWICNIGDSKVFLFRDDAISQLSVDHTDAKFIQNEGIKRKPSLTQHLGIWPQEMIIEPFVDQIQVNYGDEFLICSDGLTDMVSSEEIANILTNNRNVDNSAQLLMDIAMNRGGKDNTTIILISAPKKHIL